MKTTKLNTYSMLGFDITRVAKIACDESKRNHLRVSIDFNGVSLFATPKKSPVTIVWEFHTILDQRGETWRCSKNGQKAKRDRELEIERSQSVVNNLVRDLPAVLESKNMDALMEWLSNFAGNADDVAVSVDKDCGLNTGGLRSIADLLTAAGYKDNDCVGMPQNWFTTRERMGRWIAGQAINCMLDGMTPHPITMHFVEKYKAL